MKTEEREYEYNWEGTNIEGMAPLYITARFDVVDGDGGYDQDWSLTEFNVFSDDCRDNNCTFPMKDLFFWGKYMHHYIEKFILVQRAKE